MNEASGAAAPPARPDEIITRRDLFLTFAKIGLLGFGGVTPWLRRVPVEERGWLDDDEFAELFGFASTLPGANTVSLAILLGDRHQGPIGALAAVIGLLAMPLLILSGISTLYGHFAANLDVEHAIAGAAAAVAGLVIGNGIKMIVNMKPDVLSVVIIGVVFGFAGLLHLPLVWILLACVPASIVILMLKARFW